MKKEYLDRIKMENSWLWDKEKEYYLVVTDDLDSLMSSLLILDYRPNWKIGGFFDYRDGLYKKLESDIEMTQENTIWVDCSSIKSGDKCVSNHLTSIAGEVHNINDINLNSIDGNNRDNDYFSKYNLSTFLLLASIFAEEGYKIEHKAGMVLSLLFDSSYKAYFQPSHFADKGVQARYLCDVLELGYIYDIQKELTKKRFMDISRGQFISSKVYANEFCISPFLEVDLLMFLKYLNIDVCLTELNGMFVLEKISKSAMKDIKFLRDKDLQETNITSYNICNRNNIVFSCSVDDDVDGR